MFIAAILSLGYTVSLQAQVMKAADLEKYAKEKYGEKWLDAAANLASGLTLDKNQSLTYQPLSRTSRPSRSMTRKRVASSSHPPLRTSLNIQAP